MLLTSGSFAGVTKDKFVAPQRLHAKNLKKKHSNIFSFCIWLVGLTDSDGGFSIEKAGKDKFAWSFYIDQHLYNIKILIYVRSILGVGSISDSGNMRKFRIRDKLILKQFIIPIFSQIPLLTSKMYRFKLWVEALEIWEDLEIPKDQRVKRVLDIKEQMSNIPNGYKSPAFDSLYTVEEDVISLNNFYNPNWVAGFVEGDGSFNIVKKETNRFVPGFTITQKLDPHILLHLKSIFHIKSAVRYNNIFYILDTTSLRSVTNIMNYFKNLIISMKYIEYRIWCKAIYYYSLGNNNEKICNCRNLLRKFRDKKNI